MIKLMIVDDEENTREGLKTYIPWQELGIQEVCEAEDGMEALEVFESEIPDILLCDVRMPRMNGIELSERIRQSHPECKIIFLSGFADKDYLKSAIKLGALDYIEKPVVMKELKSVIGNAVSLCVSDKEKKLKTEMLEQKLSENAQSLRQELVEKLINQYYSKELSRQEIADIYQVSFSNDAFRAIAAVLSIGENEQGSEREILFQNIIKDMNDRFSCFSFPTLIGAINPTTLAVIANSTLPASSEERLLTIDHILNCLKTHLPVGGRYMIGVGTSALGTGNICGSYKHALEAAEKAFFTGYDKVIFAEGMNHSRFMLDEELYSSFEKHLLENQREQAEAVVRKLLSEASRHWGTDTDDIRNIFLNLYLICSRVSEKRNVVMQREEKEKGYYWKRMSSFGTVKEMAEYLLGDMEAFFRTFEEKDAVGQKVYDIMACIEKTYMDKELSVKMIADHVYLSLNYMCGMFKKSTGKTVNDYIQEVRIQKACELLKSREIKLYEVADRVGFADPDYFTRVFKKETGMTPSGYREQQLL